ncbi:MAG: ATP phosphoribosyltransferase regulatory subunit [Campylobacterales bacterium]
MIYEHEIPSGARLYFGKSAKLKRAIEHYASEVLSAEGYEEIVTPYFSYESHQIEGGAGLIRFSGEGNQRLVLRHDSSLDVARLITKRLGRTTAHRRWFYIQPVFRYPAHEIYQIGVEILEQEELAPLLEQALSIVRHFGISPVIQLSDPRIVSFLEKKIGLRKHELTPNALRDHQGIPSWVRELVWGADATIFKEMITTSKLPQELSDLLTPLVMLAEACGGRIEALAYASMAYYNGPFFRLIAGNETLAMGGCYDADEGKAAGFALYLDAMIHVITTEQKDNDAR